MRFLLDTNLLLRSTSEPDLLSPETRALIQSPENSFAYSPVSVWKTGIKHAKHPATFMIRPEDLLWAVHTLGYEEVAVRSEDALNASALPPYHRDPFDRMLVAQALANKLVLLTTDELLTRYSSAIQVG